MDGREGQVRQHVAGGLVFALPICTRKLKLSVPSIRAGTEVSGIIAR